MQTTIQTYKLAELYTMYGRGESYRTFQRKKSEFVEVAFTPVRKRQRRYLDKTDSQLVKTIQELRK